MRYLLVSLLALLTGNTLSAQELIKGNLMIAPLPVAMEVQQGSFMIGPDTWIMMGPFTTFSFEPTQAFKEVFKKKSGYVINEPKNVMPRRDAVSSMITVNASDLIHKEGYNLKVSSNGITITASTDQGVFYAFQTLRQIMRMDALPDAKGVHRNWEIPAVEITDYPQFAYRGLHLDVCRHFMPLNFVKKYIDLLAFYKMNRFHWHLTDDQGWRMEIKQYPKLQEIAAWRDETLIGHYRETPDRYDGTRHGGFYTQEEIKEVVAYAASLGVTIIPEIEMPGHALAALSAYPELGCTPGPFKAATTWGVFDDVMCPNEETFAFLENVLDEVMELFPSKYIHIGGDECPKVRWKESDFCQELMVSEGLKDEHELQSYFIQRIEKYVNSKGRSIIGWDEILEGGLAPNATVMSWRGVSGGIEAAKAGHDVIMTPGTHCYLDHYQADPAFEPLAIGGLTTLEKVYSFNPVPSKLTSKETKHILGAQANLWTEYIDSPAKAEYMAYPRAIALAEALWTPVARKDWTGFVKRLDQHLERLDGMKVNYAKRLKVPEAIISSGAEGLQVIWKTDLPDQQIFYTQDLSAINWKEAASGDTTFFSGPGTIYYRTENSGTKELKYNPTLLQKAGISCSVPPSSSYPGREGVGTLIDGLVGKADFNGTDWCAWNEQPFTIQIDLNGEASLDTISIGVLSIGSWIYGPQSIGIEGSMDGEAYVELGSRAPGQLAGGRHEILFAFPAFKAKFLRINISPLKSIPEGKPGAGRTAWTFIDEIGVY